MADVSTSGPFGNVPVDVVVTIGRARAKVADLLQMQADSVLRLDRSLDDPVELFIGERLIARGELTEHDENGVPGVAVRITELVANDKVS